MALKIPDNFPISSFLITFRALQSAQGGFGISIGINFAKIRIDQIKTHHYIRAFNKQKNLQLFTIRL